MSIICIFNDIISTYFYNISTLLIHIKSIIYYILGGEVMKF